VEKDVSREKERLDTSNPVMKDKNPEQQLAGFIAKYTPEIGALAQATLAKMRARLPGAIELVYDNYNALAIGFGATERASDVIFSIALYPRWVSLFFFPGVDLPDPENLLKGSGKVTRHIVIKDASDLDQPAVKTLMAHALDRAEKPIDSSIPGKIIIKSISAKQRPRRPAEKGVR
jgi:hypothetical protein